MEGSKWPFLPCILSMMPRTPERKILTMTLLLNIQLGSELFSITPVLLLVLSICSMCQVTVEAVTATIPLAGELANSLSLTPSACVMNVLSWTGRTV